MVARQRKMLRVLDLRQGCARRTPHLLRNTNFYIRNTSMVDIIMLALTLVSFALAMAYASLCDHLLASPVDEDATS
jgi:hypothetical protein